MQSSENNLILRWDSVPHHRHLKTFPFHLHTPQGVEEHPTITLLEVLDRIEAMIEFQAQRRRAEVGGRSIWEGIAEGRNSLEHRRHWFHRL